MNISALRETPVVPPIRSIVIVLDLQEAKQLKEYLVDQAYSACWTSSEILRKLKETFKVEGVED